MKAILRDYWLDVAFLALTAFLLYGCSHPVSITAWDHTGDTAKRACVVLSELQCQEAKPKATTCEDSINRLVTAKVFPAAKVDCIAEATSVEAVRKCKVRCVQ